MHTYGNTSQPLKPRFCVCADMRLPWSGPCSTSTSFCTGTFVGVWTGTGGGIKERHVPASLGMPIREYDSVTGWAHPMEKLLPDAFWEQEDDLETSREHAMHSIGHFCPFGHAPDMSAYCTSIAPSGHLWSLLAWVFTAMHWRYMRHTSQTT